MLDFTSLEKALSRLKEHHQLKLEETNHNRAFAFETATIKSFEYTYELALKMLKRLLEDSFETSEIDTLSFKSLVRFAAEKGLIDNPEIWFSYREKRNTTAHTYDESKADKIFAIIPDFANEIEKLLERLKASNKN